MNAKARIRIYSTNVERERRFTMKTTDFQKAVTDGFIKIYDAVKIEQIWFGNSNKYTARIRKTIPAFGNEAELGKTKYEHTVKHHISKTDDYEVTTDLLEGDYAVLYKLHRDAGVKNKTRIYVRNTDGTCGNYYITVDIPDDDPDVCFVEFEEKQANKSEKATLSKPEWIKEYE